MILNLDSSTTLLAAVSLAVVIVLVPASVFAPGILRSLTMTELVVAKGHPAHVGNFDVSNQAAAHKIIADLWCCGPVAHAGAHRWRAPRNGSGSGYGSRPM